MTETAEKVSSNEHFTPQQIQDYCEKVRALPGNNRMLDKGVQIIKQLQVEA